MNDPVKRPGVRGALRALVALSMVALAGCTTVISTSVVLRDNQRALLEHAVFIESKGIPARMLDEHRREFPDDTSAAAGRYAFPEAVFSHGVSPYLLDHAMSFGGRMLAIESAIRREVEAGKVNEVVLVIHGGRNTLAESMDEQLAILERMRAENPSVYPLFIKYESEDMSSYAEHLLYTRPGQRNGLEKTWRIVQAPFALVGDLAHGVGRMPLNWYQEISREYTSAFPTRLELSGCAAGIDDHFQIPTRGQGAMSRTVNALFALPASVTRAPADALIASLGPGEWETMKRRAQVMLALDHSYIPAVLEHSDTTYCPVNGTEVAGVVGKVVAMLDTLSQQFPALSVSVLAHSTGAIVACKAIHASRGTEIRWRNLVFMGAACTINEFDVEVRPMLESPRTWRRIRPGALAAGTEAVPAAFPSGSSPAGQDVPVRFFNLCLHPTAELQEFSYPVGAWFVRGTLLTWIDDFLAAPGTFRDRTLGRADNAVPYMNTLPAPVLARCYLKVFDYGRGPHGEVVPKHHSDFMRAGTGFWRDRFWTPDSVYAIQRPRPLEPVKQSAREKRAPMSPSQR